MKDHLTVLCDLLQGSDSAPMAPDEGGAPPPWLRLHGEQTSLFPDWM